MLSTPATRVKNDPDAPDQRVYASVSIKHEPNASQDNISHVTIKQEPLTAIEVLPTSTVKTRTSVEDGHEIIEIFSSEDEEDPLVWLYHLACPK